MRQDVFVVAYQEAKSELLDITCRFEELRQRKEKLEGVLTALGPLVGAEAPAPAATSIPAEAGPMLGTLIETTSEPVQPALQAETPVAQDEEDITDPFQRRLRDALRFSAPHREGLLKAI